MWWSIPYVTTHRLQDKPVSWFKKIPLLYQKIKKDQVAKLQNRLQIAFQFLPISAHTATHSYELPIQWRPSIKKLVLLVCWLRTKTTQCLQFRIWLSQNRWQTLSILDSCRPCKYVLSVEPGTFSSNKSVHLVLSSLRSSLATTCLSLIKMASQTFSNSHKVCSAQIHILWE